MEATLKETWRSVAFTLILAALTGLVYPLVATGVSQLVFNYQANGSLIYRNGHVVGSALIGQYFTSDKYFHGRPSATVDANTGKALPYNAGNSAGSNYGPSNPALLQRVQGDVTTLRKGNPTLRNQPVPVDLVTTDFSGLDPDISPAAALLQVDRVAAARGLDPAKLRALVTAHIEGPVFGLFGEPHVNVLSLNLALDAGAAR